ncbi:hypothetical protein ACLMAL_34465 [Nocardia sp. CWNU-33]|uniref:hypothetical protein n=1 Tax=Nocardia sp. CWNU-33 TaxID=3392117 RepID=UPI00398EAB01
MSSTMEVVRSLPAGDGITVVVAYLRTDISGASQARHRAAIEKFCVERGYRIVEWVAADLHRNAAPLMRLLTARDNAGAHAVVTPGADHLGSGVATISAVAYVITLEPPAIWWRGERLCDNEFPSRS